MSPAAAPRRPPLRSSLGQGSFPSLPSSHNGSEGNFRAEKQHQYRRAVPDFDPDFYCGEEIPGVSLRPCTGPRRRETKQRTRQRRSGRTGHAAGKQRTGLVGNRVPPAAGPVTAEQADAQRSACGAVARPIASGVRAVSYRRGCAAWYSRLEAPRHPPQRQHHLPESSPL